MSFTITIACILILCSICQWVAWVYLSRPDKKNAMNPPAWKEAPAVFESLSNDPDVHV